MEKDLLEIIDNYGYKHQREYLGKEYQELQDEIYKFINGEEENMLTEISDVLVLTFQFMAKAGYDFGLLEENIKREMLFKIKRQKERMKNESKNN